MVFVPATTIVMVPFPLSLALSHQGRGDFKAPLPSMGGVGGGCMAVVDA